MVYLLAAAPAVGEVAADRSEAEEVVVETALDAVVVSLQITDTALLLPFEKKMAAIVAPLLMQ